MILKLSLKMSISSLDANEVASYSQLICELQLLALAGKLSNYVVSGQPANLLSTIPIVILIPIDNMEVLSILIGVDPLQADKTRARFWTSEQTSSKQQQLIGVIK